MEVIIPVNTHTEIHFPADRSDRVQEGRTPLEKVEGLEILSLGNGELVARMGSGHYRFMVTNH
jgi:hypothetical protein